MVLELIRSDLMRYAGRTDGGTLIHFLLHSRPFRLQCVIRMVQAESPAVRTIGRFLYRLNRQKRFIQISTDASIGKGFCVVHEGPVVVAPCEIGDNVTLSQFTTIAIGAKLCDGA